MIGTVLVLLIVLLAMAGIMMWGVPAIQGLQEHAEYESVLTQMVQLNGDLRTLRDPQNTRLVTITMNQGELLIHEGSRWAVSGFAEFTPSYHAVYVDEWEQDSTNRILVKSLPQATTVSVYQFLQTLPDEIRTANCGAGDCPISLDDYDGTDDYRLPGNVTRVQYKSGTTVVGETWIFDVGRITYSLDPSEDENRIHIEMGAVFTEQVGGLYLQEKPTVKEPTWDLLPKDSSYVVRMFVIDGLSSASGKGRHTVLANLVDNYGFTDDRPSFDPSKAVRIQVDDSGHTGIDDAGLLEEGFCTYFSSLGNYTQEGGYTAATDECDEGEVNVLYNPDDNAYANGGKFFYELIEAEVLVLVRPF